MKCSSRQPRTARLTAQLQTRRSFLRCAASLGAAPWLIPASALGADGTVAPSERINVGLSGIGLMGSGHLRRMLADSAVQVVAVCDVDAVRREAARQRADEAYAATHGAGTYRGCAAYNDYREMLARPGLDAVLIATPDHWHALQSIDAAKAGKDVYCEKPVSLTIQEGRCLAETVRRYGTVFQTGTQYRSISTIRRVCAFVRAGGLGRVKSAFTLWGAYQVENVGPSYVALDPTLDAEPVPEGLDWDLWVGPAPWRPYNHLYHRNPVPGVVPWVFCESFGAVAVTGYQSHAADVIQYALGAENSGPVELVHPGSGEFPTLTCRYANGVLLHHVEHWSQVKDLYKAVPPEARLQGNFGGLFVGERGWLTSMSGGGPIQGGPEELFKQLRLPTREVIIGDNDHHRNWLECVRTRERANCCAEVGHRSASLGHLVAIALRLGRSLKWDPVREQFTGDAAANRLLSRPLRAPWKI